MASAPSARRQDSAADGNRSTVSRSGANA